MHQGFGKPRISGFEERPVKEASSKGDPETGLFEPLETFLQIFSRHVSKIALLGCQTEDGYLVFSSPQAVGFDIQKNRLPSEVLEKAPVMSPWESGC